MNLPNLISLSRIALMPFILISLRAGQDIALLVLMLAAVATDFLDGLLARRLGKVSDLGKVLDPLADKVCIDSMAVALSLWRGFPWWATGLIVVRDLLILAGGLFLVKRNNPIPVSNWPGKIAATVLAGAIVFYAMGWQPWGFYALLAGVAMILVSGAVYLKTFLDKKGAR